MLKIFSGFIPAKTNITQKSEPDRYKTKNLPQLHILRQDTVNFSAASKLKLPKKELKELFDQTLIGMGEASDKNEKLQIFDNAIEKYDEIRSSFLHKKFPDKTSKDYKMLCQGMFHEVANFLTHLCANCEILSMSDEFPAMKKYVSIEGFQADCKKTFDEIINSVSRYQGYLNRGLGNKSFKISEIFGMSISPAIKMAQSRNIGIEIQGQKLLKSPTLKLGIADYELDQVFSNLVHNAVKYNQDGGKIKIKFSQQQNEKGQNALVFSIEDTGIGILPEDQKNAIQGKRGSNIGNTYGTGYGLRRVNNIVNGALKIESPLEPEAKYPGTRITCSLPINA